MDDSAISLERFGYFRDRLSSIMADLAEVFGGVKLPQRTSDLLDGRDLLLEERFKVLVLGDLKRGKSTLVNALLGERVLPTRKGIACTAIPTSVRYGDQRRAVCYLRPPHEPEEFDLVRDPGDLFRAVTIPDAQPTSQADENADAIHRHRYVRAEVYWPLALCRNGVEIEDTAGLNECGIGGSERAQTTWQQTKSVDAIILVWSCDNIEQNNELEYLKKLRERGWGSKVLFIVYNRFDSRDHSETDLTAFQATARRILEPEGIEADRVFFLSAEDALRAKLENMPDLLAASRLPLFENSLGKYLMTQRAAAKLDKTLSAAELARAEALSDVQRYAENKPRELLATASRVWQRAQEGTAKAERVTAKVAGIARRSVDHLNMAIAASVREMVEELSAGIAGQLRRISINSWEAIFESSAAKRRLATAAREWVGTFGTAWQKEKLTRLILEHVRQFRREVEEDAANLEVIAAELVTSEASLQSAGDSSAPAIGGNREDDRGAEAHEEPVISKSVTEILDRIDSDFWAGEEMALASAIGGVLSAWAAILFALPFLPIVVLGAVVAGIFGGASAADKLKARTAESQRAAIRAKGPELEKSTVQAVLGRFEETTAALNQRLNKLCAQIRMAADAIAHELAEKQKQAQAVREHCSTMRTRLQKHAVQLSEIRREVNHLDRGKLVEGIGEEVDSRFASYASAIVPNPSDQINGELGLPTERELQAKLGKELWGRLLTCEAWLKTQDLWHASLRQQLGTIWTAARETIGEGSPKEMAAFRAVVALHVAEGEFGVPKPEEVPRRWEDTSFRGRIVKLYSLVSQVQDDGYFEPAASDLPDAPAGRFVAAYKRAYLKYSGAAAKTEVIDRRVDQPGKPF